VHVVTSTKRRKPAKSLAPPLGEATAAHRQVDQPHTHVYGAERFSTDGSIDWFCCPKTSLAAQIW
jgi:hypothetical protein